jgi:GT2 family glycosyltransferase
MAKQWKSGFQRRFPALSLRIRNFFRRVYGRPQLSRTGEALFTSARKEVPINLRIDVALTDAFFERLRLNDLAHPAVSLVIVSYNRADLVENLIKSIWLNTDTYSYEIIVVENGSTAEQRQLDPKIIQRVHIVVLPERQYLGDAYNRGVEEAKGTFVVLLNNDIVVRARWLPPLIGELERDLTTGIVGPKFLFPSGELQEAGAMIDGEGRSLRRGRLGRANHPAYNRKQEVAYCSGATLALRREVFLELGGYDPIWSPGYYEDADLCFKARERGLKVVYVPASEVIHIENATMSESPPVSDMTAVIERNRKRFASKWQDTLGQINRPR